MWSEEFLIRKEPISEDCLYLNVWTGANTPTDKRPVLIWIYGGGFGSGGTNVPIYDGEAMAKKGIIFVSINYRVGIFGFFALPQLTKESGHNASGNYGLMDQIAALKWVQKHIAAFGGDPTNVTIAGQSAGSMSVNALVASPLAKGLFKRAIGESGAEDLVPCGGRFQLIAERQDCLCRRSTGHANRVASKLSRRIGDSSDRGYRGAMRNQARPWHFLGASFLGTRCNLGDAAARTVSRIFSIAR